ncbi:unnamed protein product [Ambrosiozyma monospora]|uniref:Unnamed protein product n=1 Tax=Ambrosiozyma monospora TaxID=43982 RepID=A0A9W6YYI2_AMBMO|nr:unnamed protein product [Ambrosiozyma monospora]
MNLQPTRYPSIHIIERSTTANQQLIFPSFFHLLFSTLQFTDNTPIHGRYFQRASINIFNWVKMVDYQLELDKVDLIN